ncbi:MAG: hypothetical protein AMXMBFR13_21190 [Phycisphaerae bacterium]
MANILVIDDHPINREYLVTLLGYSGHRLLEAIDGAEGLELARSQRPDLIISDVLMPTMDGYEFVRQLRCDAQIAGTPVIFYTAHYQMQEAKALARRAGVAHVLMKSCDPQVILDTVGQALGENGPSELHLPDQFDREHLRLVTDQLHRKVDQLQTANLRLTALLELARQMACEPDPQRLIESCCRSARDLVGSQYAGIGLSDGEETIALSFSGGNSDLGRTVFSIPEVAELCRCVRVEGKAARQLMNSAGRAWDSSGSLMLHGLLGSPIRTPSRSYGWLCLVNKLGGQEFTEEDEQLAVAFAGQVGVAFENAKRFDEIQHYISRLEAEMAERRRVEEELLHYRDHLEALVAERTAQLEASQESLRRSERLASIGTLAAGVAHEINNPLNAILLSAQFTLTECDTVDPLVHEVLSTIVDESKRCGRIVRSVLKFAKDQETEKVPVSLNDVVHRGVSLSQGCGEPWGLRVEFDLADELPPVALNQTEIEQVIVNLVQNAVQAKEAPCCLTVKTLQSPERLVRLMVQDDGPGIPAEHVSRIFDPFYSTRHHKGGTGLGLSMVHGIITSHGGTIQVDTRAGEGTTFIIDFPPAADAPAGNGHTGELVSRC